MTSIRVVLADDHQIVLNGLKELISKETDMEVVGMGQSGNEAVRLAEERQPHVMILDVTMSEMNGIEASRAIRKKFPDMSIVGLSMHDNKRMILEMLKAGARGYVLKEANPRDLLTAIRAVSQGMAYLSPKVTVTLLEDYLRLLDTGGGQPAHKLSPRETEVLRLLVRGTSTREIGQELHISKNTVDTHRRKIMDKLGCNSIAELTRLALKEHLVEP